MPTKPTPEPTPAPPQPVEPAPPARGGSYLLDPATGQLVREGGTEPPKGLTPNDAFGG